MNYTFFPNHFAAFGLRWGQPGQQHGLRLPRSKSSRSRSICSARVSGFFTIVTQQIHSLRASGVSPFHRSCNFDSPKSTFRKSLGIVCTTPELSITSVMRLLYQIFEESKKHQNGAFFPDDKLKSRSARYHLFAFITFILSLTNFFIRVIGILVSMGRLKIALVVRYLSNSLE
mgnify:CR=1 FL=1